MATDAGSHLSIVRCPVCLIKHQVPEGLSPSSRVRCAACDRVFDLVCAPASIAVAPNERATLPLLQSVGVLSESFWWFVTPILVLAVWGLSYAFFEGMKGPEFLVFYGFFAVLVLIAATTLRHTWRDTWSISIVAFLMFEGTGVIRYIVGSRAGMHKWGFMFIMMVLGGVLFFLRAKEDGKGYGIGGSCGIGSCGGGGCGGGGCGGGGCGGGCGGCGS